MAVYTRPTVRYNMISRQRVYNALITILGVFVVFFIGSVLLSQKLLIARYVLSKNGYYIYYKKAKEYIMSIDLQDAKVYHNSHYIAHLSYIRAGIYPPDILNVSLTCENGYTDIKEHLISKHIRILSQRFPLGCIKNNKYTSQGELNSKLYITPSYVKGFMDFKNLNINSYHIKSLKLSFHKKDKGSIFTFDGKATFLGKELSIKGSGTVDINQDSLANSKISGIGLIDNTIHIAFGGDLVNPQIDIK